MSLTVTIESAELKFRQILEEFFISVYNKKDLSSHGIDHHRRVWSYAKELLFILARHSGTNFTQIPSKLIIACYLHDIGMSVETGIRHGNHSRDLCLRFLEKNHLDQTDFMDVILTIENHDNKDYQTSTGKSDTISILSVADDLDAFGFIGIFRYLEIYLTRVINNEEIGLLIRDNARKRYVNFEKSFGFNEEFVQKHEKRYRILDSFFIEYNNQVGSYQSGGAYPSGYYGVVEMIRYLLDTQKDIKELYTEPEKYSHDPVIQWFLNELATELS